MRLYPIILGAFFLVIGIPLAIIGFSNMSITESIITNSCLISATLSCNYQRLTAALIDFEFTAALGSIFVVIGTLAVTVGIVSKPKWKIQSSTVSHPSFN